MFVIDYKRSMGAFFSVKKMYEKNRWINWILSNGLKGFTYLFAWNVALWNKIRYLGKGSKHSGVRVQKKNRICFRLKIRLCMCFA